MRPLLRVNLQSSLIDFIVADVARTIDVELTEDIGTAKRFDREGAQRWAIDVAFLGQVLQTLTSHTLKSPFPM